VGDNSHAIRMLFVLFDLDGFLGLTWDFAGFFENIFVSGLFCVDSPDLWAPFVLRGHGRSITSGLRMPTYFYGN
jgi:hypothetical protein